MKSTFISMMILLMSGTAYAQTTIQDNGSPCQPLRLACASAGFVLTGATPGNRLVADCMVKLVTGGSATSPVTGQTAVVPAGANAKACGAHIHHGRRPQK